MANFNRVILAGNLTRDPELSYTASNTPICKFGLAVNRRWRDRDGNQKEDVCYVDLTAFGRQGETINQYMRKGSSILIEGRLNFSRWTDKEGQNRSKLDVVVENSTFLGGGGGGRGSNQSDSGARGPVPDDGYGDDDVPPPPNPDIPF